jgi:hypothetical protein
MARRSRVRFAVQLAGALLAVSTARADDSCFDAYEKAQRLQRERKLRQSSEQLGICAREACPLNIRRDCARWLEDVEQALPTIVFAAQGPKGEDLADVTIRVDGEVLSREAPGAAVSIDPGHHEFRFERAGMTPVTTARIIREGEKRRRIEVTMESSEPRKPAPAPAPAPAQPDKESSGRPIPPLVYVLGGAGLLSVGAFGFFTAWGFAARSDLDQCKPRCPQQQVDDARNRFAAGDVFLGIGLVTLGVATVLYFTRPAARTTQAAIPNAPPGLGARPAQATFSTAPGSAF